MHNEDDGIDESHLYDAMLYISICLQTISTQPRTGYQKQKFITPPFILFIAKKLLMHVQIELHSHDAAGVAAGVTLGLILLFFLLSFGIVADFGVLSALPSFLSSNFVFIIGGPLMALIPVGAAAP